MWGASWALLVVVSLSHRLFSKKSKKPLDVKPYFGTILKVAQQVSGNTTLSGDKTMAARGRAPLSDSPLENFANRVGTAVPAVERAFKTIEGMGRNTNFVGTEDNPGYEDQHIDELEETLQGYLDAAINSLRARETSKTAPRATFQLRSLASRRPRPVAVEEEE